MYRKRLPKPLAVDTPQMRAAVNFVLKVHSGSVPDEATLKTLADAFSEIFGGRNPVDIFGEPLGLVRPPNRPADYGFTADDIVSAFIELRKRQIARTPGRARSALTQAKAEAAAEFVDFQGARDPIRAVERHWSAGKATVEGLSDEDLEAILAPYKIN